ncbi:MAG TPA: MFS transporter [Trebonia sp.]|nr:MFS transporter [Trebonia sp.]
MTLATRQAPSLMADHEWRSRLGQTMAGGHKRRGKVTFVLLAFAFATIMAGTTLPTPLYVIYATQFSFSPLMVSIIYATYAVAVMAVLLLAGRSSDQVGRKPVIAAALCFSALSAVTFILAPNVVVLYVGRVLSGVSAGLMTGTATAGLTELYRGSVPRRASLVATTVNIGGFGLGPLLAGLFSQYAPDPTTTVFEVYLGALAVVAICLWFIPETVRQRQRLALRYTGLGIPTQGRGQFLAAAAAAFSGFALFGLFSSVVPGFMEKELHQTNHAIQGAVVFAGFALGVLTQLVVSRFSSQRVVMVGLGLFLVALGLIVAALKEASLSIFLAGICLSGVAVGSIFLGSLTIANRLAPPERRAQVVSTFFVACYLGLIIPVVGVGVLSRFISVFSAVLTLAIVLAVLCLFSLSRTIAARGMESTGQ